MKKISVKVKANEGIELPSYATPGSAGMDLRSSERIVIRAGETALVPTGLFMEIPFGYEGQVRPRSGLALKHGITVPNTPGTIDSDYRGELKVILMNLGKADFVVEPGDRIAQLVFAEVTQGELVPVEELSETERSSGGFGSTGTK